MQKTTVLLAMVVCLAPLSHTQLADDDEWSEAAPPEFEAYGLASGMKTIDAT